MKQKENNSVEPKVLEAVKQAAVEGRLTCTAARELARELNVPVRMVGTACDILGIKIKACELGCF
ncbi:MULTISPECIES: hypothetical protein [Desulfofundulus]|uniref:Uncharacterized protein n=2 Tax=Desulfofundulus TaxID=2282741 RepID=A0A1M6E705_9FIRM|nr:hypothetical protein [Desulfofundulus thermosubterraneus]AEG16414.1 hypothetical protein Desku_2909 [Desulfofundulus kuznetsovii DSM 6115]SHI81183.1 hypothetical protein SAMN02745219_01124 [Desulfofundulus thermosubterraneus DSM 16057]